MGRKKLVSDEQLLEAAREVFVTQGLTASTREVARRAGVSEAVLFQRYDTKADLFFAAMSPPAFDLNQSSPEAHPDEPGERAVRSLFLALLDYFRQASPVLIQLLANQEFEFERFASAHPDNSLVTLRWAVGRRLMNLRNAGKIGADPASGALVLFAATQGLAIFERLGAHGGRFEDSMIEGVIASVWTGMQC